MKISRIYTLILVLIISFEGNTQTNVYHPYPQGWGATWHSEHVFYDGMGGANYSYSSTEWGGDTIINSLTYTKVYDGIGSGHQYSGGVRQNIALEEAYFIDDQNIEHDISFDQNAMIGDTIKTGMLANLVPDSTFIVNSIDSIFINGDYRKYFVIVPLDIASSNLEEATFLSGVGFISYWGNLWSWSLQCHSVEHNWLYGGIEPVNPICILSIDNLPIELSFKSFPNPTIGLINLNKTPKKVRLYSTNGVEINPNQFVLNQKMLDISTLSSGIYLAHFEFESGIIARKIVKH